MLNMKAPSLIAFLFLYFFGVVQALSSAGSRLLVVTDNPADKGKYSKFWGDLEGTSVLFATIERDHPY
jgi:hypothetical protein